MPKDPSVNITTDPFCYQNERGFTLLELLLVISMLAILAVVGVVTYSGLNKNSKDTKRKQDVESIAKLYESKFDPVKGKYFGLDPAGKDFSSGIFPTPPEGGSYSNLIPSAGSAPYFNVCAALEDHPLRTCNLSRPSCFCIASTQSGFTTGAGGVIGTGAPPSSNLNHPAACDRYGTLGNGLYSYWKADENSGTILNDFSGNNRNGSLVDVSTWTSLGKKNAALSFNGSNTQSTNGGSNNGSGFSSKGTISFWIYGNPTMNTPLRSLLDDNGSTSPGSRDHLFVQVTNEHIKLVVVTNTDGVVFNSGNLPVIDTTTTPQMLSISGNWHLVTITYDSASTSTVRSISLYVDKKLMVTKTSNDIPRLTNWRPWNSGGGQYINFVNGAVPFFYGKVDDIRLYNRQLETWEITNLYNSGDGCFPP